MPPRSARCSVIITSGPHIKRAVAAGFHGSSRSSKSGTTPTWPFQLSSARSTVVRISSPRARQAGYSRVYSKRAGVRAPVEQRQPAEQGAVLQQVIDGRAQRRQADAAGDQYDVGSPETRSAASSNRRALAGRACRRGAARRWPESCCRPRESCGPRCARAGRPALRLIATSPTPGK